MRNVVSEESIHVSNESFCQRLNVTYISSSSRAERNVNSGEAFDVRIRPLVELGDKGV